MMQASRRARVRSIIRLACAALAAAGLIAADASGMGRRQPALKNITGRILPSSEILLAQSLISIGENRLDEALDQIESLLKTHPDFQLAQLVKGDLLLARARPLQTIGDVSRAPADRLAALREEARARLARYQETPPKHLVPKYLLQLQPEQRYALVVDTAKSTLYVFENDAGRLRYAADYYVSLGKNGIDKQREGDKKTPLGVYHVVTRLPNSRLTDFYGAGAWPINYPNEWDSRRGRRGHGIWLHGSPRHTYSRPPRASDGCVVLTNADLEQLGHKLQPGLTPVIIADAVEWVDAAQVQVLREELAERVEQWRRDWEAQDRTARLTHYVRGFSPARVRPRDAAAHSPVNSGGAQPELRLSELSIFLYPGYDELAVVTFLQDESGTRSAGKVRKRQYWVREDGQWKIAYEGRA